MSDQLVTQDSAAPTRKVTAATFGAGLATVIVLTAVWLGAEQPPVGLEGGLAAVLTFLGGYFVRERA